MSRAINALAPSNQEQKATLPSFADIWYRPGVHVPRSIPGGVMEMDVEQVLTWLSANWLSLCALAVSLIAVIGQLYNYNYTVYYTKRLKKQEKITELMLNMMEIQRIADKLIKTSRDAVAMHPDKEFQDKMRQLLEKLDESERNLMLLMEGNLHKVSHLELEKLTPHFAKAKQYHLDVLEEIKQKGNCLAVSNKQPGSKP